MTKTEIKYRLLCCAEQQVEVRTAALDLVRAALGPLASITPEQIEAEQARRRAAARRLRAEVSE